MFRTSVGRDLKDPRSGRRTTFSFSKECFTGLAAGLAVAVGVVLWSRQPIETTQVDPKATLATERTSPANESIEVFTRPSAKLTFYGMLPTREMLILSTGDNAPSAGVPITPIKRPGFYVLHFGMYRDQALAEQPQAKLRRLGGRSEAKSITLYPEVQHRVRVRAISDLKHLNHIRATNH
jgi:hypothetical protein